MTDIARVERAFGQYGFTVSQVVEAEGQLGVVAEGPTIGGTGRRKKAFYVEGSPHQMGYLVGRLAPDDVLRMAEEFNDRIVLDFLDEGLGEKLEGLGKLIVALVEGLVAVEHVTRDLPADQLSEIAGLARGCVDAGRCSPGRRRWLERRLVVLNAGIDVLLAMIYPLELPHLLRRLLSEALGGRALSRDLAGAERGADDGDEDALGGRVRAVLDEWELLEDLFGAGVAGVVDQLTARHPKLRVPVACNAFAVFGAATKSGAEHYFGRDFFFPTADVFQDTACLIVRRPVASQALPSAPTLSVAAPGMVGSVMAVSARGVAAGVDMVPAACCDPTRPGLNSLMLVRHAVEHALTGEDAVELMIAAQRGVSWLYPVAYCDPSTGASAAYIVEAGERTAHLDAVGYTPLLLRSLLPDRAFVTAHARPDRLGVAVRGAGDTLGAEWLAFNPPLFAHFGLAYDPAQFGELGELETEPKAYYFAPQRETRDDLLIATNAYLDPRMRLTAMNRATVLVTGQDQYFDIQRRYDELNRRLLTSIDGGGVDLEAARAALYRLSQPGAKPSDQIQGSITIAELHSDDLVTHTHIGYFGDEWVTLGLMPFLQ